MAYKDKDKQKEAVRQAVKRHRQGITKGITSQGITLEGITPAKPGSIDPDIQAIWDKRNAQGQPASYSSDAQPKDYPRTHRLLRAPEPVQDGQTQAQRHNI